jgi:hypothetical protein
MQRFASAAVLAIVGANAYTINGNITFDVSYDSATGEVVFVTSQPDKSYFGILLGSHDMINADAIVFFAEGQTSKAQDYYSTTFGQVSLDATQNVTSRIITVSSGTVILETRRKLKTTDAKDFVIPLDQTFEVSYAFNLASSAMQMHSNDGHLKFTLSSTNLQATITDASETHAKGSATTTGATAVLGGVLALVALF